MIRCGRLTALLPCVIALLSAVEIGCTQESQLVDYPGYDEVRWKQPPLNFVNSIALVGTIRQDVAVGNPTPSHWDTSVLVRLHRLDLNVENVLRGNLDSPVAQVFYFTFAMSSDGPRPLGRWPIGQRLLLFVHYDSNVLRTICDGIGTCVRPVANGRHDHLDHIAKGPLSAETLSDLFLTKGSGVTETAFADSIMAGFTNSGFVQFYESGHEDDSVAKGRLLALAEDRNSSEIRESACEVLDAAFNIKCAAVKSK